MQSNSQQTARGSYGTDVFVSYSRRDQPFVRKLHDALVGVHRDVWVDWEDIPPSAEWLKEIERAIESADTVVFVLSPDSVSSPMCRHEVDHAATCNKRMVALLLREVLASDVPEPVAKINWLPFRSQDDFQTGFSTLIEAMDTDLNWVRAHSRLLVRAKEWESHNKDKSYVLLGTDLDEAEKWLANSQSLQPTLGALQVAYVAASRQEAIRLQRNQLRGFYLVSLIYAALQVVVSYFVAFDNLSETALMYLSPLWVVGLVFGGFGLTFGRTSLKRSIIASLAAGIGLYLFFITLWPLL
jgi:TIR domain